MRRGSRPSSSEKRRGVAPRSSTPRGRLFDGRRANSNPEGWLRVAAPSISNPGGHLFDVGRTISNPGGWLRVAARPNSNPRGRIFESGPGRWQPRRADSRDAVFGNAVRERAAAIATPKPPLRHPPPSPNPAISFTSASGTPLALPLPRGGAARRGVRRGALRRNGVETWTRGSSRLRT